MEWEKRKSLPKQEILFSEAESVNWAGRKIVSATRYIRNVAAQLLRTNPTKQKTLKLKTMKHTALRTNRHTNTWQSDWHIVVVIKY